MGKLSIILKSVRMANKIVNFFLFVIILLIMGYSVLGLYNVYGVYKKAEISEEVLKYKPVINNENKENDFTFEKLKEMNSDVCGWLTIENTKIDYPILQGENNFTYINKSFDGEFSLSGSVFLDVRNNNAFKDFYSLLYAHHMEGEAMFGVLPRYQEKDFFDKHSKGYLFTEKTTYSIEIFSCIHTDSFDEMLFNPTLVLNNSNNKEIFLNYLKEKAKQYKDIEITTNDLILGMSTCYDTTTNGRILVFAKLTEVKKETIERVD